MARQKINPIPPKIAINAPIIGVSFVSVVPKTAAAGVGVAIGVDVGIGVGVDVGVGVHVGSGRGVLVGAV